MRPYAASLLVLLTATVASAKPSRVHARFETIDGYASPGTPAQYDKVGILEIGPSQAKNVLVLNPGTSASAAYFGPLAGTLVDKAKGWQVWAVERRENFLEDQSVLDQAKDGGVSGQQLFDYYLGWLTNSAVTTHFQFIADADVAYAREWGMRTEIEDLRRVVLLAKQRGAAKIVVGGHSLGGTITTAYATWDFDGVAGGADLAGLVFIDGASDPTPAATDGAMQELQSIQTGTPWLTFGGIGAPYAGLFNATGSLGALIDPAAPSIGQAWPFLPANLKPPIPVTNLAQYGYALDTETSPPGLIAAQAHLGHLAKRGDPRGWVRAHELTPIDRYAMMFSGKGLVGPDGKDLHGRDGTAWYHPRRLTLDAGAVANGNANDLQTLLDVHATHGHDLPPTLRLCAFGAGLGGPRVLDATTALATQSGIPSENVTLLDRHDTYAHNDPNSAFPKNDFIRELVPFLKKVARGH